MQLEGAALLLDDKLPGWLQSPTRIRIMTRILFCVMFLVLYYIRREHIMPPIKFILGVFAFISPGTDIYISLFIVYYMMQERILIDGGWFDDSMYRHFLFTFVVAYPYYFAPPWEMMLTLLLVSIYDRKQIMCKVKISISGVKKRIFPELMDDDDCLVVNRFDAYGEAFEAEFPYLYFKLMRFVRKQVLKRFDEEYHESHQKEILSPIFVVSDSYVGFVKMCKATSDVVMLDYRYGYIADFRYYVEWKRHFISVRKWNEENSRILRINGDRLEYVKDCEFRVLVGHGMFISYMKSMNEVMMNWTDVVINTSW